MRRIPSTCFLLVLICSLSSCRKGMEKEVEKWDRAKGKAQELMAVYPSFTVVIENELKTAQLAMNRAMAENGRKARMAKMAEASSMLQGGTVGFLDHIDKDTIELRNKVMAAASAARTEKARVAIEVPADRAQGVLKKADDVLVNGVDDEQQVQIVLKQLESDVRSAIDALDKVLRDIH